MKLSLTAAEKMLALFVSFTLCLLIARVVYTGSYSYMFYPWNLFLAIVPVCFSRALRRSSRINGKAILLVTGWLVFFPNAPYIITDIFHFTKRSEAPQWYDLLLVLSAAWSGLMAGFISLGYVERFLSKYCPVRWRFLLAWLFLFAASTGIYLGRYLRMNSWNVVTKPVRLAHAGLAFAFKPFNHAGAWAFCIACSIFLLLIYYSLKKTTAMHL
ncbi:MAG TPA: DUF1361 domain-containing protein [Chitinophagaceae bacterium]|nr:DUF1361 domain-containing protein [Chitinophagaceae bacterium]